ncbi:MAG: hypothetical protein GF308_19095 [Candidatus Heimdallarchaeota archaeon]|nr:hypothetical protein [Candidatus Heimdallarchaeota archaeon]
MRCRDRVFARGRVTCPRCRGPVTLDFSFPFGRWVIKLACQEGGETIFLRSCFYPSITQQPLRPVRALRLRDLGLGGAIKSRK